jgi:ankyrin repeat protein
MFSFLRSSKNGRTKRNLALGGAKKALFKYASEGNLNEVERLTSLPGINVNYMADSNFLFGTVGWTVRKNKVGSRITPLQVATLRDHTDVVRLLIERGADVNLSDSDTKTALMLAIQNYHYDSIKLLLENGADKYAVRNNTSPFLLAVQLQDPTTLYVLLHSGVNDSNYMQSVYAAAKDADAQMLVYIIEREIPEISADHVTFPLTVVVDNTKHVFTEQQANMLYQHLKKGNVNASNGGRRKAKKGKKTRKARMMY